jgi:RNA recognition motif-containing protein
MNGKVLDLKAANPREQNIPPPPPKEKKTRKIFIGGLPKDLSTNEFRAYFQQYGEIIDIAIITDKKTREPRGKFKLTRFRLCDI